MTTQNELLQDVNSKLLAQFMKAKEPVLSLYTFDRDIRVGLVTAITDIKFDVVSPIEDVPLEFDQYVTTRDGQTTLMARKGEMPVAMYIFFAEGMYRLKLDDFIASPKSFIELENGTKEQAVHLKGEDLWALIGKKVQVTNVEYDYDVTVSKYDTLAQRKVDACARQYTLRVF